MIKVQYLGPLRSYPSRVGATRAEQNPSWLSDGQHAWDILRNNPSVRVAVNEWLGNTNKLDTPYRLERRELIDLRAVMNAIASHEHDMEYETMLRDVAAAGTSSQSQLVLSEHFILRIMRRIRECRQGRLPQGMPDIGPGDVSILYVEPMGGSSVISLLELDEFGQLLGPWPGGFFEEGFRERFS